MYLIKDWEKTPSVVFYNFVLKVDDEELTRAKTDPKARMRSVNHETRYKKTKTLHNLVKTNVCKTLDKYA